MKKNSKRKRYARHGEPKRFLEGAVGHSGDECLLWPHASRRGYGLLAQDGKMVSAHRVVCERAHGPALFEGAEAAHTCGNSLCVNPAHLRWASPAENQNDRIAHGTANLGVRNGRAKLSESDVRMIRKLKGTISGAALARKIGVSAEIVRGVWLGRYYASVV